MTNTTDKQILTAAGKALLAQLNAEEKALVIDKMMFANVPNRPEYPQPDDVVPSDHVNHEAAVEQRGRLSVDSVIYSTTLTSQEGPFEFNWTGTYCSEYGVLVTIDHHALTPKTADEPGVAGNTLVRSVVLEYKDIAAITNITVDASSWQYNANPRMKKMDNDTAQANIDQNGKDWFIDDGFQVTPQANAFSIKAGAGYVSGNRVLLEFDRIVQVPNKPSFIYVDAHREGTSIGEQVTLFDFVITAEEKDDYTNDQGVKHFVCKLAQVLGDGSVSDLRPDKKNDAITTAYVGDSSFAGGNIWPVDSKKVVRVGDKLPAGIKIFRVGSNKALMALYPSPEAEWVVSDIDEQLGLIKFNNDTDVAILGGGLDNAMVMAANAKKARTLSSALGLTIRASDYHTATANEAIQDSLAVLNKRGGTYIYDLTQPMSINMIVTHDACTVMFETEIIVEDGPDLDKSPAAAVYTTLCNFTETYNFKAKAKDAVHIDIVAYRDGDYTYDKDNGVVTGRKCFGNKLYGASSKNLGRNGVGCGVLLSAACEYSYGCDMYVENGKGQSIAVFGGNRVLWGDRARDINNRETAYYIGSQHYNRLQSLDCTCPVNGKAIVNKAGTGTGSKISRGSVNCSGAVKIYAYGDDDFTKTDTNGDQPMLWAQGGTNTLFDRCYVELNNLTEQTIYPVGLFVHGQDQLPLDITLRDAIVKGLKVKTTNCPKLESHLLIYPINGGNVENLKITEGTFDSDRPLPKYIQAYINDPDGGTINDLYVYGNTFKNGNGVQVELGPNAKAGTKAGKVFIHNNIVQDDFVEKIISTGDDVYTSPYTSTNMNATAFLQPVLAGQEKYKRSVAMRLYKADSETVVNGIVNLEQYPEQCVFTISASWDMENITLMNAEESGRMQLIGNVNVALKPFEIIQLMKVGADLVQMGAR